MEDALLERASGEATTIDLAVSALHRIAKNAAWVSSLAERLESGVSDERRLRHSSAIRDLGEETAELARTFLLEIRGREDVTRSRRIAVVTQVERVLARYRVVRPGAEIRSEVAPDLQVALCGAWLEFVVVHLVENAIEATSLGDTVRISGTVADGIATISVSDTGRGMGPGELTRCTRPGFSTRPERGGTGLGLTTAMRLVEAAHGTFEVESKPGQGTTVCVSFPLVD